MAPVGIVLPSRAMATLPPAKFSAMMPEPTTVASRNAVPINSAVYFCNLVVIAHDPHKL